MTNTSLTSEPILSLNGLFETRVKSQPDSVVVAFPRFARREATSHEPFVYDEVSYRHLDALVAQASASYATRLHPRRPGEPLLVVGLLAESGFEYVVTELALARLGHCVLLLSPNNSIAAIANLLQVTKATHLLCSKQYSVEAAEGAKQAATGISVQEWWCSANDGAFKTQDCPQYPRSGLSQAQETLEPAFIVHSSGSTGFPKPIWVTHKASVQNLSSSFGRDAFITVPLYHNYGHASLWRAMWSCKKLYIFPQSLPLTTPNLINALSGCRAAVQQFYAVPYVLKLLAETPEGLQLLRDFDIVTSAGSACPVEVGNRLVAAGVKLVSNYGATEVGQLMTSMRDFATDHDWDAVRMHEAFAPFAEWVPHGDEAFELVVKAGWPAMTKSNRPDGSYATSDLFTRHSTRPGAYLFVGRADDTLVHSNGEKTNPIPMELSIRGSPHVADAIVFGAGRPQTGALIILADGGEANDKTGAMQRIWPSIQEANSKAASHSRIVPELVHFLPPTTRFPSADKGSIIRAKVIAAYEDVIDSIYAAYEEGDGGGTKYQPADVGDAIRIIRKIVCNAIDDSVLDDDADLFDRGIDSLTSTRITNAIRRKVDVGEQDLPSTLVFECPTVRKLAERVYGLASASASASDSNDDDVAELMRTMVDKYSALVEAAPAGKPHRTRVDAAAAASIVLTGATGSLGAHLLHRFSTLPSSIARIWCLCRAKSDSDARSRVEASLRLRQLPSLDELARRSSPAVEIVCIASDLTRRDLGVRSHSLDAMLSTATAVVHAAWPVNFNMSLASFVSSLEASVHLMNLCSRARHEATFHFCSSISATIRTQSDGIVYEEISKRPHDAQEMGYAQSKWVMEAVCDAARHSKRLPCVVHRIGQMVGDSVKGVWNETEAIPLMIRGAQVVGALPDLQEEQVSWLPVDQAAELIANVVAAGQPTDEAPPPVVHILNDVPTSYREIYAALRAAGLQFDVAPPAEWVQRLRTAHDQDPVTNPTVKLVDFYARKYGGGGGGGGGGGVTGHHRQQWDTTVMRRIAVGGGGDEQRVELRPIDAAAVGRMVEQWRRSGFLQ